jgi:energy-coupling factor transport system permease protein
MVFRALPGTSALHRLGAAPKLLILVVATILELLAPGWPTIAVLAVVAAAGIAAARLPWSVVPRLSWWVVAIVAAAGVASALGGGLWLYARSLLLTAVFLALTLLLVWTTRVEDLPAAFSRIARPLRAAGAPVEEWAHTLTLTVRTLPLLRDEIRVLIAARRLRPRPRVVTPAARVASGARELLDLTAAIVASAGRRATDLGRAATQRGGMQPH